MAQSLTKEEEQLLCLCEEGTAPIGQFAALLDRGVRLNIHDKKCTHPLRYVSYYGRRDLADLFLQHGAKVDLATNGEYGETALIGAGKEGHLETVRLLLHRGALVNYQSKDGLTALCHASRNNHLEVVKFLIDKGAQVNKGLLTGLYGASLGGNLNIAQYLLDHGADVNQPTDEKPYSSPLSAACAENHLQVAELLINSGANVDYKNGYGRTPLHSASHKGHTEVVKLLVQSHANVNIKDILGSTPLQDAVEGGHSEVVKQLLLSQANLHIKNNAGQSPLQIAEDKHYSIIVSLLKGGVPVEPAAFSKDMSCEQLSLWLRYHRSLSGADYEEDISKLRDARINGHVFLSLNESRLERFSVSVGFQFAIINIIEDMLQKSSQQPPSSERLPLQQQSPRSSVATPRTTQHQLSSSTAGQQTKLDELPTLDELLILKYTDEGTRHKLRIIDKASHKWKDIANLICGDVNVTNKLKEKCGGDPNECLKQTFIDYFINKKPQGYTQDWNGLIELLDDINLQTLAEKIKHALSCAR